MATTLFPLSAVILCDRHGAGETAIESWALQPEGRRALDHLTATLEPHVDDIILVTRDPLSVFAWNGLIATPQKSEAPSLLEELYSGLTLAHHPQALGVTLDAPWIESAVVELLIAAMQPRWEAVLPQVADRTMPFPAIYAKGCLHRIGRHLQGDVPGMGALLKKIRFRPVSEKKLRLVDPRLRSFEPLEIADERKLLRDDRVDRTD
jgi:molybdopterin-guanine dinucleotide biosynthesis protein A